VRRQALERKGICRVFWGSHGCTKQRGHIGQHICSNGCIPCPVEGAFGEDWDAEAYAVQLEEWCQHRTSVGKPVDRVW